TPPPSPTPLGGRGTRLSLALDGVPWAAQAGVFLAAERGYFAEVGLDVHLRAAASREAALGALASGDDDLALVGGLDLLRARGEGAPVVSLFAVTPHPLVALLALRAGGPGRPRDLDGRRVASSQGEQCHEGVGCHREERDDRGALATRPEQVEAAHQRQVVVAGRQRAERRLARFGGPQVYVEPDLGEIAALRGEEHTRLRRPWDAVEREREARAAAAERGRRRGRRHPPDRARPGDRRRARIGWPRRRGRHRGVVPGAGQRRLGLAAQPPPTAEPRRGEQRERGPAAQPARRCHGRAARSTAPTRRKRAMLRAEDTTIAAKTRSVRSWSAARIM